MRFLPVGAVLAAALILSAGAANAACSVSTSAGYATGCTLSEFLTSWLPANIAGADFTTGIYGFDGYLSSLADVDADDADWLAEVAKSADGTYSASGQTLSSGTVEQASGTYAVPVGDAATGIPAVLAGLAAVWAVRRRTVSAVA